MAQTVFDVGDPIVTRLSLGVTPDGTTVPAISVIKPDGSLLSPVPGITGPLNGDEYTAQFSASQPGDWVAIWTVSGTGAGTSAKVYNVRPLPTGSASRPAWVPFLSDVADYVPRKTRDTTPGSEIIFGTFNGLTEPSDGQVQRILDKVVATILAMGSITPVLEPMAAGTAALRAAADVELAWPERTSDMIVYQQLDSRAKAAMEELEEAVERGDTGAVASNPVFSFPASPPWADDMQLLL
jgi:hypothetical protein